MAWSPNKPPSFAIQPSPAASLSLALQGWLPGSQNILSGAGGGDAPPCSLHLQWPPLLPHWDDLQPWLLSSIAKPAVSCGLPFSLCPSHSLPLILLPLLQSYQSLSLPVSYQDHQGPFSHPRLRRVQGYLTALGSPEWREQPPSTETLGLCPISAYAAY